MANINLYDIYNNKLRKLGYSSSATLQEAFVEAVNNTFSELNANVFNAATLSHISSFDDIIDNRLSSFASINFDTDAEKTLTNKGVWAFEFEIDMTSAIAGSISLLVVGGTGIFYFVFLPSGVLTITFPDASTVSGTYPTSGSFTLKIDMTLSGLKVYVDGEEQTSTTLDAQAFGTVSGVSITKNGAGPILREFNVYTENAMVLNFPLNEGSGTTVTDAISGFTGTVSTPVWETVWYNQTGQLNERYLSAFNMGVDYHLQEGGQWAMESVQDRERKWYGRGIPMARNIYQQTQTYTSPLNP